jgi:rRNA-processing protein FCF1
MSSINTIAIETTPVVLAVATKPKPVVQRKKKTFPVVARCEGVEDESIPEPSIADTLLNIIQTKPDIKAPAIRKKKAISVADVIGSVIDAPKPVKKTTKKDKTPDAVAPAPTSVEVAIPVQTEILGEPSSETVVPEPAPKAIKKRAPKKKAEVVIQGPVLENIESLENNQIQEPLGENAEQVPIQVVVPEPAPKAIKKRAPKKKVEVVIQGPVLENIESTLENNQIQEPLGENAETVVVVPEPAPKVVKKRAPKKKVEVVIPEPVLENIESTLENNQIQEPLGEIAQTVLENIESLENNQIQEPLGEIAEQVPIQVVVPEPAPKVVKKRAPKKKAEVVIPGPVLENIESLENNQIQETLGENAETVVVPEPAPKAIKKRAPKKKVEVVIPQPVLENIESNTFDLTTIQDALGEIAFSYDGKPSTASINTLDTKNPMEWFDEQAKQIDLRREPILNTFFVPVPELDEELYQLNTRTYEDKSSTTALLTATLTASLSIHQTPTLVLAEQPIYDGLSNIIANTLENEDYSDEIMVETLEFNGQTYWIDAHHNVLDKETFAHIGLYKPETATIVFY